MELYKLDDSKLKSGSGRVQILMKEAYDLIGESKNGSNYKCQVKNGQKCAVKIPHFDSAQVYL